MSSPEIAAVQMQLAASADQLQVVSDALDLLRRESVAAILELRRSLAEARYANRGERVVNFVNVKSYEGGKFTAKVGDYKPWAKRAKIFCNSQCRGFAAVLERAEEQPGTVELGRLGFSGNADQVNLTRSYTTSSSPIPPRRRWGTLRGSQAVVSKRGAN